MVTDWSSNCDVEINLLLKLVSWFFRLESGNGNAGADIGCSKRTARVSVLFLSLSLFSSYN
jgi:hypothetical protein